jgi:hypothetical protein
MVMKPTCLKEATKIGVTVICVGKTKNDTVYIETDSLLGATRVINTFKPKRGYEVVKIEIEEVGVLQ